MNEPIDYVDNATIEPAAVTMDIRQPQYDSQLSINEDFHLCYTRPPPNWWWRFWQRVLLGWKWKKL